MTWHGMACTLGSPYGGAHGSDVAHEGNRGAVLPPLCVTTRRAKTVLNTGRHLKSTERLRGRGCMIAGCVDDRGKLSATSTPRPRPRVGGRGDRRADVWRVGRCDRGMLPRGRPPVVRVVPGCAAATCVLPVRWTRFAPPAASKPSAVVEGRSSIVRGMERLSALRSCTLVSARPAGGAVHSRGAPRTELEIREELGRSRDFPLATSCSVVLATTNLRIIYYYVIKQP